MPFPYQGLLAQAIAQEEARQRNARRSNLGVLASTPPQRGLLESSLNQGLNMEGRATFLPFQDTLQGSVMNERSWALPGLLASAWNAFTAPRRAYTGQLDPNSEEAMGEAMNVAGLLSGGGSFATKPKGALGMVSRETAKTLKTKVNLPTDDLFNSAVRNTPGAQITPDGLILRVQRNQAPQQAGQQAVRGGMFYLPEGAAQAKHYSTGKHGYGGAERVSGETVIHNPMFVKGATGGKAPEAAFDMLKGKGSYEAMRNDALKAIRGWDLKPHQKAALADEFLDVYAPEMSGMGEYIVRNSGQGNQLPYALQEAAVASAVRKSGHDVVLGYSMSRNTKQPFISEIFDVREMTYPNKFGSQTEIWETFKK